MICRRCGSRIPEHLAVRESFKCPECGRQFGTPTPERAPAYEERSRYSSGNSRYAGSGYAEDSGSRRYGSDARAPRYSSAGYAQTPRSSRYGSDSRSRYAEEPRSRRASSRFEPEYDERYSDRYYADDQQYADDGYYYEDDQQYSDDGYYKDDQQYSDDGYYYEDDQQYSDDGYYYEDDQQYVEEGYYDDSYADYNRRLVEEGYSAEEPQYSDDDLSDLINGGEPRPAGMKLTTVLVVLILGVMALIAVFCIDAAIHPEEAGESNPPAVETTQSTDSQYPTV